MEGTASAKVLRVGLVVLRVSKCACNGVGKGEVDEDEVGDIAGAK